MRVIKNLAKLAVLCAIVPLVYIALPITYHIKVTNFGVYGSKEESFNKFILELADSNDTVVVHVDSPGGAVVSLIRVVNAIDASAAKIITHNDGIALSAGGVTAVLGDEITANKYSIYMFHRPRYIDPVTGKIKLAGDESVLAKLFKQIARERVFPLLTADEIQAYLDGKDVTVSSKELLERVKNSKK